MTTPSYTTDLTTVSLVEPGATFTEFTGYTLGGPPVNDTDYIIQGTGHASTPTGGKTGLIASIAIDNLSPISIASGECIFMWQVMLAGSAMETFDNGGLRVLAGASITNFDGWKTGGKDFGRNPYGGWQNVVVSPGFTPDYTGGTGSGGVYQVFGSALNEIAAISKGNLHGMDAIRKGRGQISVFSGEAANYGTFLGMATTNDS